MELIIGIIKVVVIVVAVLNIIPILIWWERKGAAYIQDRRGPNRASILGVRAGGLIHSIADVFKLLFKEDIMPKEVNKPLYILAPMIVMGVVVAIMAVIPFASPLVLGQYTVKFQIADLNIGILYILAISSLGVYGIMLAGWSSSNVYSLLGALRASAQMISYEVAMGLALVSVILYAGTVRLDEIIILQDASPIGWNFIYQPLAFIIFLTCLFAETNRNPFDLPEGESELVAGYHTEYSSMKFALFFMAEYAHIIVGSMILVCLFFGGWQVPFLTTEDLAKNMPLFVKIAGAAGSPLLVIGGILVAKRTKKFGWGDSRDFEPLVFGVPMIIIGIAIAPLVALNVPAWLHPIFVVMIQLTVFLLKVLFFCWVFIWVRWTLPRFRYDQLMHLGWKVMVPLALVNIFITTILITY